MSLLDKLNAICTSRDLEKKVVSKIIDNGALIAFIAITVLAICIRYTGRDFTSNDYIGSLCPWFDYYKTHGGFAALGTPIGDYNIPYQFLIALMAYIDINQLYQFKILSCIFDFVLAVSSGYFVYYICSQKTESNRSFKNVISSMTFVLPYGVVLCLPTVILNSSLWAQCDAIYTSFVVLSLLFVYKRSYFISFVFLGFAFAFKLQTVFILPFFLCLYFREKRFSILFLLFLPLVDIILAIPSLCFGLPFSTLINVYLNQSDFYPFMYLNYPSFWAMFGDNYEGMYKYMKALSVMLTMSVLLLGVVSVVLKKVNFKSSENFLSFAIWVVWTCVMFLPSMHERYAYVVEVLIIVLFFAKFWSGDKKGMSTIFIVAVALQLVSCVTYGYFLFKNNYITFQYAVFVNVITYIMFTYKLLIRKFREEIPSEEED